MTKPISVAGFAVLAFNGGFTYDGWNQLNFITEVRSRRIFLNSKHKQACYSHVPCGPGDQGPDDEPAPIHPDRNAPHHGQQPPDIASHICPYGGPGDLHANGGVLRGCAAPRL